MMKNLIKAFKLQNYEDLELLLGKVIKSSKSFPSKDGTVKFLLTFKDDKQVETVLIPFRRKYSVCLSSQVGCQVKCSFCYTGTLKNFRQLESDEIAAQYIWAFLYLRKINSLAPLPNIVFMGQGEPFQNFENVKMVIESLTQPTGLYLGPRQITVSTSGHIPGLKRFKELGGVNLAISLHSANDVLRTELIPLNKMFPLQQLKESFLEISKSLKKKQFITMEYLLLSGVNDNLIAANEFAHYCEGLPVIVNLIPFNEYPGGKYKRPTLEHVENFKQLLVARGMRVMIRITKGDDVYAACGQLALHEN